MVNCFGENVLIKDFVEVISISIFSFHVLVVHYIKGKLLGKLSTN